MVKLTTLSDLGSDIRLLINLTSIFFLAERSILTFLNDTAFQEHELPDVHFSAVPQSPEIASACRNSYRSAGPGTRRGQRLQVVHERSLALPLAHLSAASSYTILTRSILYICICLSC